MAVLVLLGALGLVLLLARHSLVVVMAVDGLAHSRSLAGTALLGGRISSILLSMNALSWVIGPSGMSSSDRVPGKAVCVDCGELGVLELAKHRDSWLLGQA